MEKKSLTARILAAVENPKLPKEQITGRYIEGLGIPHGSVGNTLARLVQGGFLVKHAPEGMLPYYTRTAKPFENITRGQRITTRQREAFAAALEGIPAPTLRKLLEELDKTDKTLLIRRIRATVPWSYEQVAEHVGLSASTIVNRQKALLARLNDLKPKKRKTAK